MRKGGVRCPGSKEGGSRTRAQAPLELEPMRSQRAVTAYLASIPSSCPPSTQLTCANSCTQGLLQMMESEVTVTTKSSDVQTAQKASKDAEAEYKEKSGKEVKVTVEEGLSKDR